MVTNFQTLQIINSLVITGKSNMRVRTKFLSLQTLSVLLGNNSEVVIRPLSRTEVKYVERIQHTGAI